MWARRLHTVISFSLSINLTIASSTSAATGVNDTIDLTSFALPISRALDLNTTSLATSLSTPLLSDTREIYRYGNTPGARPLDAFETLWSVNFFIYMLGLEDYNAYMDQTAFGLPDYKNMRIQVQGEEANGYRILRRHAINGMHAAIELMTGNKAFKEGLTLVYVNGQQVATIDLELRAPDPSSKDESNDNLAIDHPTAKYNITEIGQLANGSDDGSKIPMLDGSFKNTTDLSLQAPDPPRYKPRFFANFYGSVIYISHFLITTSWAMVHFARDNSSSLVTEPFDAELSSSEFTFDTHILVRQYDDRPGQPKMTCGDALLGLMKMAKYAVRKKRFQEMELVMESLPPHLPIGYFNLSKKVNSMSENTKASADVQVS